MTGLQRMVPVKNIYHKEQELDDQQEIRNELLNDLVDQAYQLFQEDEPKEFLLDSHTIRILGIDMDWAVFVDNMKAFSIVMDEVKEINWDLVEILK